MIYKQLFMKYRNGEYVPSSAFDILYEMGDTLEIRLISVLFDKGLLTPEDFMDITHAYSMDYYVSEDES